MSLEDWAKNGWLKTRVRDKGDVGKLFALAERDLKDCKARGLSDDWRFSIAYNAALQATMAALAAAGYEVPKGESHHFRAIQSLEHTIGATSQEVVLFDAFRKKRNAGVYDAAGAITKSQANEMVKLARELVERVRRWIEDEHSDLLED